MNRPKSRPTSLNRPISSIAYTDLTEHIPCVEKPKGKTPIKTVLFFHFFFSLVVGFVLLLLLLLPHFDLVRGEVYVNIETEIIIRKSFSPQTPISCILMYCQAPHKNQIRSITTITTKYVSHKCRAVIIVILGKK